jgi:haloalkane dehalogenase
MVARTTYASADENLRVQVPHHPLKGPCFMFTNSIAFSERYIARGKARIYARDYAGDGPAFVLMHGFPDNLHIWDDLIPYLVASGRRVVAFDFLGFGASDKPADASYSFRQQLADLEAIVEGLGLEKIVPVAHDSSGMATLNYALTHPDGVESAIMLNSAYSEDSTVLWPEMITLFATPSMQALAAAIAQNADQFGWLLTWQQQKFRDALPEPQKPHFDTFLGPLIRDNFIVQPSAGPAFVQLAAQFFDEHARNAQHLTALKTLDIPVKLIWGQYDPYFPAAMAERRKSQLKNASLTVVPGGHWLQVDESALVAKAMLS